MARDAAEREIDLLREKANLLRVSLLRNEALRRDAAVAFAAVSTHMATVDEAILPSQATTWEAYRAHGNVRRSARAVEEIVAKLDLVHEAERVISNRASICLNDYLDAVDKLRSVKHFFTSKRSCRAGDDALKRVDEMLSRAAVDLAKEFQRLLSNCSKPVELERLFDSLPSYPSSKKGSEGQLNPDAVYSLPTLIHPSYVPVLSKLVQKSIQLSCRQQFLKIYSDIRSSTLELTLKNLGVEHVTKEEVQTLQVENLDAKIAQWVQFFRIAVKLLFAAERGLCDQIFDEKDTGKDHGFAAATSKGLLTLLSFGVAVAKSQISPEKVYVLLDMYEATLELQPEVEAVFEGNACSENRKSALALTRCLAQAAKRIFGVSKENIMNDSPKSTTTDGSVHALSRDVMSYIKFLADHQSSLKQILQESRTGDRTTSDVVSQIVGVIDALETNLDVKSKQYKDPALGNLFLMNNIHYIVRSICSSEVKCLFGDDWIQRRRRIVKQHATQYQRVAWGKVLESLSTQGLTSSVGSVTGGTTGSVGNVGSFSGTISRSVIKARFRSFNKQFEEVCQEQIHWAIPNRELRDNLILAVAEIMLPAYRSFLRRFGPLVEKGHNASKYIKYTPEALEQALGNLFSKKLLSE